MRLGSAVTGSKELIPIAHGASSARPVCEYLLLQMRRAGIEQAVMVIREGKDDIPATLSDRDVGLPIRYVVTPATRGVPHTLDRAYDHLRDNFAALGFPDILVHEPDCLARLVCAFQARPVDVLLGLFPLGDPHSMDAVDLNDRRVRHVIPKPGPTTLTQTWAYAIWHDRFTRFLHATLARPSSAIATRETYLGDVFESAIAHGLAIEGVAVSARPFLDIGTPDGLRMAQQRNVKPA